MTIRHYLRHILSVIFWYSRHGCEKTFKYKNSCRENFTGGVNYRFSGLEKTTLFFRMGTFLKLAEISIWSELF